MEVTEKNCRVADKIIEILVNEKCTVEETQDILSEVTRGVRRTSTVQVGRKILKSISRMRFYFCENVVKEFFTTVRDFIQTSGN